MIRVKMSLTEITMLDIQRFIGTLMLLLSIGTDVVSQYSQPVVNDVTCPLQIASSTPDCSLNNARTVSWIQGGGGAGGGQTRFLTFNITSLIVNRLEIDLVTNDDLEVTVQLLGDEDTRTTSFRMDCADSYVRRSSERELCSCQNISVFGASTITVWSNESSIGAGEDIVWWQSFTKVQINITSSNSSVNSLRIYGLNEPTQQCNCHPAGVANISDPCNTTSRICGCRANFTSGSQCIPQLSSTIPYGPQNGGYWLELTTSAGGGAYIGNRSQVTVVIGDSYFCLTPNTFVSGPRNELVCKVTRAYSTDVNRALPITVCWTLTNTNTNTSLKACSILTAEFTYKPDPEFISISPLKGFSAGGTKQTITGTNLDSLEYAYPYVVLEVTYVNKDGLQWFYDPLIHTLRSWAPNITDQTTCEIPSSTTIVCRSPPFYDYDFTDYSVKGTLRLFLFDSSGILSTNFQLAPIIEFMDFTPETQEYRIYEKEDSSFNILVDLSVNGRINAPRGVFAGAEASDYSITVGGKPAKSITVGPAVNIVSFYPPLPEPADSIQDLHGAKEIVLTIGYHNISIGYLDYQQTWIDTPEHRNSLIGGLVGGVGGVIIIVVFILLVCKWWRRNEDTTPTPPPDLLEAFLNEINPERLRNQVKSCLVNFNRVHRHAEIGKGNFGKVYRGTLTSKDGETNEVVAMKVLHGQCTNIEEVVEFLEEAVIMKDFAHDNVLSLRAISIDVYRRQPYVILPIMENGDLKKYISDPNKIVSVADLLNFGLQIAEGMEYLSIRKFVHRDLAARNCMINGQMICKVADFGLARDVYPNDYYRPSHWPRALPFKWMSIEALNGFFTTKSDVWSFGVLLWELLTRGGKPYAHVDIEYMPKHLIDPANRLEKPPEASQSMYELMSSCWLPTPDERPDFTAIKVDLKNILSKLAIYPYEIGPIAPVEPNSYLKLESMIPEADYLTNE